jgi:sulfoxide reductase catalytic subunit YedY
MAGLGGGTTLVGCNRAEEGGGTDAVQADDPTRAGSAPASPGSEFYPARRNPAYALDRPLTDEKVAAGFNNFYEFSTAKDQVEAAAARFTTHPWTVEVRGMIKRPRTIDFDEIRRKAALEERLYRHRCVEAWAMAVPWTGFPMRDLVRWAEPLPGARYVRLVSFMRPQEASGQRTLSDYPWPYFEALTMAEATNELTFMATGIYGHELPKQHGAPLRLVVPWKYGFKGIKSIVLVEFTDRQPSTFWSSVTPGEYDFVANVDPGVPHPRWSQATERMIGTDERLATTKYNGYGAYVAQLYGG